VRPSDDGLKSWKGTYSSEVTAKGVIFEIEQLAWETQNHGPLVHGGTTAINSGLTVPLADLRPLRAVALAI
jgi:hypothetical protein